MTSEPQAPDNREPLPERRSERDTEDEAIDNLIDTAIVLHVRRVHRIMKAFEHNNQFAKWNAEFFRHK